MPDAISVCGFRLTTVTTSKAVKGIAITQRFLGKTNRNWAFGVVEARHFATFAANSASPILFCLSSSAALITPCGSSAGSGRSPTTCGMYADATICAIGTKRHAAAARHVAAIIVWSFIFTSKLWPQATWRLLGSRLRGDCRLMRHVARDSVPMARIGCLAFDWPRVCHHLRCRTRTGVALWCALDGPGGSCRSQNHRLTLGNECCGRNRSQCSPSLAGCL